MAVTTEIKSYVNSLLRHINIKVDSLTAERSEAARLNNLNQTGHFERAIFPSYPDFDSRNVLSLLQELQLYKTRFDDFEDIGRNDVRYTFHNEYFASPDAEILYAIIRKVSPRSVVEVGSGYSTKIIRQAILDGGLKTTLISVDPQPRTGVEQFSDTLHRKPVETLGGSGLFESLKKDDIVFIDSSHEVKTGNDVIFLYLNVLPGLQPGVLVHIHDVFLPYDYPQEWVIDEKREWNEQYLVQALLTFSSGFDVLWPGYFLQRTMPGFPQHFPHLNGNTAKSLWLMKKA